MSCLPRLTEAAFCATLLAGGCEHEVEERRMGGNGGQPEMTVLRERMVREQLEGRDIRDPRVLGAMRSVPRHLFVLPAEVESAYEDYPLPIGEGQTISQPYIVALMSQCLDIRGGEKVLEVGTGSGYQAAVLAAMGARVLTIEIICPLADRARQRLADLGYTAVQVRCGDGYGGWPEEAPFDAIVVTAAPERIPQPLVEQLREGGRMVIPVGGLHQELMLLRKEHGKTIEQDMIPVRFVPMTGEVEKRH